MEDWQRERYLLHSRLPKFRRRANEAIITIKNALTEHPGIWALSYSGGKDSTVMLDLCVRAGWRGPILWQSYGDVETLPENRTMAEWAANHYGLELIERQAPGEFDIYEEVGHFFIEPSTKEEHAAVRRWYKRAFGELSKFVRNKGWVGQFIGLRMEESEQRRMVLGPRGATYWTESRQLWTCCPIYQWSGADVWAYLVSQNLPWSSIYDAPNCDRERLRNDVVFLAGSGSIRHGQFAHWKKHAPELFRELERRWPEVRRHT